MTIGQCSGPDVDRMWAAYHQWYAVGVAITGYDRGDEAAALMRQGDAFQVLGCPGVAHASYSAVLNRYPEPGLAALREAAFLAKASLPPPPPPDSVPGAPVPAAPGMAVPPAAPPAGQPLDLHA